MLKEVDAEHLIGMDSYVCHAQNTSYFCVFQKTNSAFKSFLKGAI